MQPPLKTQVLNLYKNLLYMGRDYPQGYEYFRKKCYGVFKKNKDVTDPDQIKMMLRHGEFVINELKALYFLKKYRTLKKRYYSDEVDMDKFRILSAYLKQEDNQKIDK